MENLSKPIYEAIIELCIERFQLDILNLNKRKLKELNSKDIAKFITDFIEFTNSKLVKINPSYEDNILILPLIFSNILLYFPDSKIFLLNNILMGLLEKELLRKNILYLNKKISNNTEAKEIRDQYIEVYLKKASMESIYMLFLSLLGKYQLEDGSMNEIDFALEFSSEFFKEMQKIFSALNKELINISIIDTITTFENQNIENLPSTLTTQLHHNLWKDIKIPIELGAEIKLHHYQILGKIKQREIIESIILNRQKKIIEFEFNADLNNEKLLKGVFSTIAKEVKKSNYFAQQENIVIFNVSKAVLFHIKKNNDMDYMNELILKYVQIDFFEVVNYTVKKLNDDLEKQIKSLIDLPENINYIDNVIGFSKILVDQIERIYSESFYLIDIQDEGYQLIIRYIFCSFYKQYYDKIPKLFNYHIISNTAKLLDCHESKIIPKEDYNGLEVAEWIKIKLVPNIIKIENEFDKLRKINSNISIIKDVAKLKILLKSIKNFWLKFSKEIEDIKLNTIIENELDLWGIKGEIRSKIKLYVAQEIVNDLIINEEKQLIKIINDFLGVDIMLTDSEIYSKIKENIMSIKDKVIQYNTHVNELKELGIHFDNELDIQRILISKMEVINKNFFNDFNLLTNEYINTQIPYLPYLIEQGGRIRLSPTDYFLFSLILDANLQGNLYNWNPKKIISQINISEKTVFNSINSLKDHDLVLKIESENAISYIINAPQVLQLAKEFFKEKMSKELNKSKSN
jgi:hypothetical protein